MGWMVVDEMRIVSIDLVEYIRIVGKVFRYFGCVIDGEMYVCYLNKGFR